MNYIVLANIIALVASTMMVISGLIKNKKRVLYIQTIQIGLTVISNLILGGITGALINFISFFRNIIYYKNKLTFINKLSLIGVSTLLTVIFNNHGIIGLLPLLSITAYTLFMSIDDMVKFKLLIIFTMIVWGIYDFSIKSYTSCIFNLFNIITSLIAIINIKEDRKKEEKVYGELENC